MKTTERTVSNNSFARYVWIGLGSLSFAIGTIGIFLPILPTFPFYLLTLVCFAKGSERLHRWFVGSRFYKDHLEEFLLTRSMTIRTKLTILFSLTVVMGAGFYFMHYTWSRLLLAAVWLVHVIYIGGVVKTKKVE